MRRFVCVLACALGLVGCAEQRGVPPGVVGQDPAQPIALDAGRAPNADAGMEARDASEAPARDGGRPASASDAGPADSGARADSGGEVNSGAPATMPPVLGVTVTDPWMASTSRGTLLRERLRALRSPAGRLPMVRVVFDEGVDRVLRTYGIDAGAYAEPVAAIGRDARIMGELLDSFYVRHYDVGQYRARACEYRALLGHLVDVWEVGNEVNGEWLGPDVIAKIAAAVEVFDADRATFEGRLCPGFRLRDDERAFELALTLYYNGTDNGGRPSADNCWARAENAMLRWTRDHFGAGGDAAHVADRFGYVWVSYYEDDCEGIQPAWQGVFDELGRVFARSALGLGECGTTVMSQKGRYVERYYRGMGSSDAAFANMRVDHPRYVGGLFWWYFSDDIGVAAVTDGIEAALGDPFWRR